MVDTKIFEATTPQAAIRIERFNQELHLKFDADRDAIQSAINIEQPHQLVMENLRYLMGILMFIPQPKNILVLGVGGGSLIHFLQHYLPEAQVTGVEFNSELMDIAHTQLKLPLASENLSYVIDDARNTIKQNETAYDLILVDIFEGGLAPQWLLQKSFTEALKQCLSKRGAVAYNLLINNKKSFSRFYGLLRQTYQQQALCLEAEEYENILVYGLNFKAEERSMTEYLEQCLCLEQEYDLPFTQILSVIYEINPSGSGII